MDNAGISTIITLIIEKEKPQPQGKKDAIQGQGIINLKYSVIIVKNLGVKLQNVKLKVLESIIKWIMLKRRIVKMVHFY